MNNPTADLPLDINNYAQIKDNLVLMRAKWKTVDYTTAVNRRIRKLAVDVETLRSSGQLRQDQTFISRRVIDTNIKNEQPPFIAYLKQSRRLAVFKCKSDPKLNVEKLETEFTEGMQYNKWELDYFKALDGAQLHGWDAVEIEYDESKPLKVGISHIGHENLIFPFDAKQVGANDMIARRFEVTAAQLRKLKKYNFKPGAVDTLCRTVATERNKLLEIFKIFTRDDATGCVYVSWVNETLNEYLSDPVKLDLGRRQKQMVPVEQPPLQAADGTLIPMPPMQEERWVPMDETEFPIKLLPYSLTEQQQITELIGRAQIDDADQEAQTNLWTAAVNGALRASNIYGSPELDESNGGKLAVVDIELTPDRIYNKPIKFWSPPWPEGFVVQLAQALGTAGQAETGQVDFAVNNRQDSRKTATEIQAANQQAALLQSVQVMLWAAWLRDIFNFVWPVVQNLALRNEIPLCQIEIPSQDGITPPQKTNDLKVLNQIYDIKPAGDIDVVQRAEKIQRMQTIWPIISQTPLAMPFLMDMLKEMFPQDIARYTMMLEQANMQQQQMQGMSMIIQELMNMPPNEVGAALQGYRPQLEQLTAAAQQPQQQATQQQ